MDINNEDILKKLSEQIRVEIERKQIAEQALEEGRKLKVAESRRAQVLQDIIDRYAHQGNQVEILIKLLNSILPMIDALDSWRSIIHDELEEIRRSQLLTHELLRVMVTKQGSPQSKVLLGEVQKIDDGRRRRILQERVVQHQRRLEKLLEKKTTMGSDTQPSILIEIEDIETAIEMLETEMEAL